MVYLLIPSFGRHSSVVGVRSKENLGQLGTLYWFHSAVSLAIARAQLENIKWILVIEYYWYQISISMIFQILKYLLRDKDQDNWPSFNCAAQYAKASCWSTNFLICPLFFAQAGWWFNSCFYAILTTGATTIVTYNPTTYHTNPSIMWSGSRFKQNNWLKFSAGKFTLKLK